MVSWAPREWEGKGQALRGEAWGDRGYPRPGHTRGKAGRQLWKG